MTASLASSITKTASKQSYYTVRFLVDRDRVEDAYRAYGYFRWVDDILDATVNPGAVSGENAVSERMTFLERQKSLLESCFCGESPREVSLHENMLVEMVKHDQEKNSSLQLYLRNMMRVMDFDARRRGRLISQDELNEYTRWLAIAVTEALHYFIGHDDFTPHDERRYLAVSGAHIIHMLRDTYEDVPAGYVNVPREILRTNAIEPQELHSNAYRDWVRSRVLLAREYFEIGKEYFAQVENPRCRLACFAYISRFEWLIDTFEKEGYCLRPQYNERKSARIGLRMVWLTLSLMFNPRLAGSLSSMTATDPISKL